ncbi:MAG TPA: CHAT domain-containing protein, partial [Pyrinomonadaceae bacterium]|nr:CHAT domain-containing protein [Pyrinomonadaceae bacterium]
WNEKLTTDLRSILLRPTKLFRAPKKLIQLAWEKQFLFENALDTIPEHTRLTGFELRQQVSNAAYPLFVEEARDQLEDIESELQLVAVVARHYISVRKFAKLDGLVYAWPRIASLAMANYANVEYVEDFFVERKPRPTETELDARDARELFELCENDGAVIRFLRLRPYFKEIDENELRRYRPLAPVTISDPSQRAQAAAVPLQSPSAPAQVVTPSFTIPKRVCELVINKVADSSGERFEISLRFVHTEVATATVTLSIQKLRDLMLAAIGTSEEALQSTLKSLFSENKAEQILIRAGALLYDSIINAAGLEETFAAPFKDEQPLRLVIASNDGLLHDLPWEWLPRPGYSELLLSNPRFSLVHASTTQREVPVPILIPPLRLLEISAGPRARQDRKSFRKDTELEFAKGAVYRMLEGADVSYDNVIRELKTLKPQIVHFTGEVKMHPDSGLVIRFPTWSGKGAEYIDLSDFAKLLIENGVQLFVVGRNDRTQLYGSLGARLSNELIEQSVPAMLAPVRPVDAVTSTLLTTEFYRSFLAGNPLEDALHTARRKVATRGGDWTAFALFANPSVLGFFQALAPSS